MTASRRVLGVFAKWPEPGHVKTRLAQALSPEKAAQVARAFLLDTLQRVAPGAYTPVLVFAPPERGPEFAALLPTPFTLTPQANGMLGARLDHFFHQTAAPTVVIGTDSPTLPVAYLDQAFASLERVDVVIGPATDGGYYLLGCRTHYPELFTAIDWSTSRVLEQTIARVRRLNLCLDVLPPWYDVDTPDDWQMLRGHLAALQAAGHDPQVPHTLALVKSDMIV